MGPTVGLSPLSETISLAGQSPLGASRPGLASQTGCDGFLQAGFAVRGDGAVGMRLAERLVWALLIVIVDAAAFALPLAALVLAYVLLARPRWFRDWVEQIYREAPR